MIRGAVLRGLEALLVDVEIGIRSGRPGFNIVGLGRPAVKESGERLRHAIEASGFEWPTGCITVNLAPADIPKEGTTLDLAIATAVLAATGQVAPRSPDNLYLIGELGLEGNLRRSRGALAIARQIPDGSTLVHLAINTGTLRERGNEVLHHTRDRVNHVRQRSAKWCSFPAPRVTLHAETVVGFCQPREAHSVVVLDLAVRSEALAPPQNQVVAVDTNVHARRWRAAGQQLPEVGAHFLHGRLHSATHFTRGSPSYVHRNGWASDSFHCVMNASIAAMSSPGEPKFPYRSIRRVTMQNHNSIWLSHEPCVGV